MNNPVISVIIVSFNTRALLRRCLASMCSPPSRFPPIGAAKSSGGDASFPAPSDTASDREEPSAHTREIIVVDNASSDGSGDLIERDFQNVRLIKSDRNLGFARATNLGLQAAAGEFLLLLNPDTEVPGDAIDLMAGFLVQCPEAGAASPALVYPDGSFQHAAFRFPTLWMSFLDFFPLNHRIANSRLNGRYPETSGTAPFAIDHPLGAAMMIRREALADIGLLDEGFFMYCEEIDWCIRAARKGWRLYQVPAARVVHHSGQSTRQFRQEMYVQLHRSRYRLFNKHYSPGFVRAHRAIVRMGILRRSMEARWQATRGKIDPDHLESELRAYRAIWRM